MNPLQGTDYWHRARYGLITASRAGDLMAKGKSGPSASRANYLTELAIARLTENPIQSFTTSAMQRGLDLEPFACAAYEERIGELVVQSGFVKHPDVPYAGCSPDALVGDDGLAEFKCPDAMARHYEALLRGAHAVTYQWQVQFQMWVMGRAWCDVVSYDPRFPEGLQLAIKRVERNNEAIDNLASECAKADREICEMVEKLKQMKGAK